LLLIPEKAVIDSHYHPESWGIRPILFELWGFGIPAYSFFVLLGLVAGIVYFIVDLRKSRRGNGNGLLIAAGAITGGILGAKLLEWGLNYRFLLEHSSDPGVWLSGRTIVGGLIGGKIGAVLTKRVYGINERRGNELAPAVALGMMIGRIGCFFRGCCYGQPTGLPFGVNFGDGVLRHPTQLYESFFMLGMFVWLVYRKRKGNLAPGKLFSLLMFWYFSFRFTIEFIRIEPVVWAGLTSFQLISMVVALYFGWASFIRKQNPEALYAGES
jgi:prolipoprotein diacylglyceryltransferase